MNKDIKLGIASEHRGFLLKQKLLHELLKEGYPIIDYGTNSEESCDYPDFAYKLGQGIINNDITFGIAICGSGIGISIALNKMKGVYAARVCNKDDAYYTRCDNNTNVVTFSSEIIFEEALEIIKTFISTEFSNLAKHQRRIDKVKLIENGEFHA